MNKVAFFTMDVESFSDTECIRKLNKTVDCPLGEAFKTFLDLLAKYGIKCTLFVLCSSLGEYKEELKEAVRRGHEIALHGLTHESPTALSAEEFNREIIKARQIIKDTLGVEVRGYRAPCFAIDDKSIQVVRNNFLYDSSKFESVYKYHAGTADFQSFSVCRNNVLCSEGFYEFAPSVVNTCIGRVSLSGGGYVRLLGKKFIFKRIKKYIAGSDTYMFYCHPLDLYEGPVPKIKGVGALQRHYLTHGGAHFLSCTEEIIKLLQQQNYSFKTIGEYCDSLNMI